MDATGALKGLCLPVLVLAMLVAGTAYAQETDPYVMLDNAKLKLGEGRLAQAREMLAATPVEGAEDFVAEEILLQQLLVNAAFLRATDYICLELAANELDTFAYADWIANERDGYAHAFAEQATMFLDRTTDGPHLDFVRFRLPVVTAGHLADLELYTDPEILGPAVRNWDDGREGLGKGLIAGQARVAFVLAAIRHYDRDSASPDLETASERLRGGVPVNYAEILDWLAETAVSVENNDELAAVALRSDERLLSLSYGLDEALIRERAQNRLGNESAEEEAQD